MFDPELAPTSTSLRWTRRAAGAGRAGELLRDADDRRQRHDGRVLELRDTAVAGLRQARYGQRIPALRQPEACKFRPADFTELPLRRIDVIQLTPRLFLAQVLLYAAWDSADDDEFYYASMKSSIASLKDVAIKEGLEADKLAVNPGFALTDTPPEQLFGKENAVRLISIRDRIDPSRVMDLTRGFI